MNIVFLGATRFSESILLSLLEQKYPVRMIFTIPEQFNISYSRVPVKNYQYCDLGRLATTYGIPCHSIRSEKNHRLDDYYESIKEVSPTVILVMGWYYMVPRKIRELAVHGAWGIHASLLPNYAGGAPLVWAIINGEERTGVTLFRLADGVDDGDIIAQRSFAIRQNDTIKEVYGKATRASKSVLLKALSHMDKLTFSPQDKNKIQIFPQRKPDDGEIDLTMPGKEIYNFIRAQSEPYPGAFVRTVDGKKLVIEKARIES
jgi:methionyl-tRNA formyltransferase